MSQARLLLAWLLATLVASARLAEASEVPAGGPNVEASAPPRDRREAEDFFERRVRPLLAEHCFACHGTERQQAGLRLDSAEGMRAGSDGGPVVIPKDPDGSRLVQVVRYAADDYQMPPKGKLPDEAIDMLETWVRTGAEWPAVSTGATRTADAATERGKSHWAFQAVTRPELPAITAADWPANGIDRFVLARLERAGLSPSPAASRETLIRRAHFVLTGLPPTAAEIERFVADETPEAFARLVDRLLESPHYGERWGRHWLDVARYADTKGYVFREDRNYPDAWRYRDWVIRAFNDDLPYDEFVKRQLAADLVAPDDSDAQVAMGFLTLGRRFINNRHDIIDDRIDVVSRGLMGLTVACARCHDHKYDPIPTADYYSLYGVFASCEEPKDGPPLRLVDAASPHAPRIFVRGNPANPGDPVPRRFPAIAAGADRQPFRDGSGRLEMAEAIVAPRNPLTARVFVNRVWLQHFGRGLVETPSDFGTRAEPPSHPELLDHLAAEFVAGGWSIKRLHRRILLSRTWRQASADRPDCRSIDPENRLLWRMNRRRLDLEALRDGLLAAGGALDSTLGGPSISLTDAPFTPRRTVYGFIDRQNLPGLFRTFDFASPDAHTPQRHLTTVPQQGLFLLNSPFVLEQAERAAGDGDVASSDDAESGSIACIAAFLRGGRRATSGRSRRRSSRMGRRGRQTLPSRPPRGATAMARATKKRSESPPSPRCRTGPDRPGRAGRSCPMRISAG
ncbi:MAG: PSD1 and planctomycete cytochrome C domain-containing protein [Planctomycetales bacterium]